MGGQVVAPPRHDRRRQQLGCVLLRVAGGVEGSLADKLRPDDPHGHQQRPPPLDHLTDDLTDAREGIETELLHLRRHE